MTYLYVSEEDREELELLADACEPEWASDAELIRRLLSQQTEGVTERAQLDNALDALVKIEAYARDRIGDGRIVRMAQDGMFTEIPATENSEESRNG